MRKSYRSAFGAVIGLFLCLFMVTSASSQCVTGTVTAEFQLAGPFAGLWKYTLDFSWDTPQGLSNVTLDCGFGNCPTVACEQTYAFDDPAGTSTGENNCGTIDYSGEFNCQGNPSIGLNDPIIKWDAIDQPGCEPGPTGSGTLCFYTAAGPQPNTPQPIVLIKDGQNVCQGTVMGDCPAICAIPVEENSWGGVKVIYDR